MKAIGYTLELKTPVLATEVEGEPNSAVSLPYLSGSLLRGALAARYLQGRQPFDAADPEARALFLSGETSFLNAYPVRDGKRALPTPLAWRHDKNDELDPEKDGRKIYNLSCMTQEDVQEEAVAGRFVWLDGETAYLFSPPRQLNVHTQRDARKGRATEAAGAVYRYDALAAGLPLRGVILTTDVRAAQIEGLLRDATLSIGRARRAGYGEVSIIDVEVLDYWRETETYESAGELYAGAQLQITFTSDALLRDKKGQTTLNPLPALAARLGVSLESLTSLPEFTRAASKIVGGFNRKWGLPLPQTLAVAAGSVFTYQTAATLTLEALAELEQQGIGERRSEGFGRLLVNWHLGPLYLTKRADLSQAPPLKALADEEKRMAEKIAERLLRHRLDEELRRRVNYTKLKFPPGRSQLSRLRVVLRDIQTGQAPGQFADVKRLKTYFERLDSRAAGQQFRNTRIFEGGKLAMNDEQRPALLREWIMDQIEMASKRWAPSQQTPVSVRFGAGVSEIKKSATPALAEEYALRLIDQILYRAAKEQE